MLAYLSLGSNLGNREQTLQQALALLNEKAGTPTRRSAFFYSEPWGFKSPHGFCNLCVALHTHFTPHELLHITQEIEKTLGRNHKSQPTMDGSLPRYYDRTIDIDLIECYDDRGNALVVNTAELTIPHPLKAERDFVLMPLQEIQSPISSHLPAFVIDLGGVIIDHADDYAVSLQHFEQKEYTLCQRYERGEITTTTFLQAMQVYFPRHTREQLIHDWNSLHAPTIPPHRLDILRHIHEQGYPMILLTNNSELRWQHAVRLCPALVEWFCAIFTSFDLHMLKPEKQIFQAVENVIGTTSQPTYFIDDSERNRIAAQKNVGWIGFKGLDEMFGTLFAPSSPK